MSESGEFQVFRSSRVRSWLAVLALATGTACVIAAAAGVGGTERPDQEVRRRADAPGESMIDPFLRDEWSRAGISAPARASDLSVLRRTSLALFGTIPSIEEIRAFEADERPDRMRWRLRAMLEDSRFASYWSERLARAWVGVEAEPFLIYRREQFTRWLARELHENRPYDELARAVLSTDGLWTSEPGANFVTSAVANDVLDHNELAARTVRGFLGQRIDCAQCHDHPFAEWKQREFEGLAAFFGQSAVSFQGVVDQPRMFENVLEYKVEDPAMASPRVIDPAVPYLPECLPLEGDRRDRLAAWVTDPRNDRFGRAAANRVWGLLFGRPYVEPVDDLPDPGDDGTAVLDLLGQGFRESGYDLRWLIEEIVLSEAFQAPSSLPEADESAYRKAEAAWAIFPLTRQRPEQVIGGMIQAGRLQTIDQDSNLLARAIRFFREQDFVREYGDAGEAELDQRSGTVSQALLRMNGEFTREMFEAGPFSSAGRITALAEDDGQLVELCFLMTLTRRPSADENAHFRKLVAEAGEEGRGAAVEDLLWALVNSAEFSWNH